MLDEVLERKNSALFEELVPPHGSADSKAGELVRAVNRIGYRFWNDGDQIGIGYGNETCNAAARYILEEFDGSEMADIVRAIWGLYFENEYEHGVVSLVDAMIRYLDKNPELKDVPNEYDMFDFSEPEDKEWDEDEDDGDYYWEDQRTMDLREYPRLDWRR